MATGTASKKPGGGRYTTYIINKDKKLKLEKLFRPSISGDSITPWFSVIEDQATAARIAAALGNTLLRGGESGIQNGDSGMFTNGVDMTYRGIGLPNGPPMGDLKDETYTKAGAPMNRYMPDISSPGANPSDNPAEFSSVRTEGTDKDPENNPKIAPSTYKKDYTTTQNTRNPSNKVWEKNTLGEGNGLAITGGEQYPE